MEIEGWLRGKNVVWAEFGPSGDAHCDGIIGFAFSFRHLGSARTAVTYRFFNAVISDEVDAFEGKVPAIIFSALS